MIKQTMSGEDSVFIPSATTGRDNGRRRTMCMVVGGVFIIGIITLVLVVTIHDDKTESTSASSLGAVVEAKNNFCNTGYWSTDGREPCYSCPGNTKTDGVGHTTCPAVYNTGAVMICVFDGSSSGGYYCKKGSYCGTDSFCYLCKPGTFNAVDGTPAGPRWDCDDCPVNSGPNIGTPATCSLCPPGRYSSGLGATACKLCPAGYDTLGISGLDTCVPCLPGTYAVSTGTGTCTKCAAGKSSWETNATDPSTCTDCAPGTYSGAGAFLCTDCPAGKYQAYVGQTSCTSCAAGTNSVAGSPYCV